MKLNNHKAFHYKFFKFQPELRQFRLEPEAYLQFVMHYSTI